MRLPEWLGIGERRWKKSPDEEVQPPKTAWDSLQLLIVPAILVTIALAFNAALASRQQKQEDRRIREDRALAKAEREDGTLDAYYAKMSSLMLDRGLGSTKPGSAVRQVARTETLATVRRLDGARKGDVVRFLREAGLLTRRRVCDFAITSPLRRPGCWGAPVISLEGADLRGVDLANADLSPAGDENGVSLVGDLRGAIFDKADLTGVSFSLVGGEGQDLRGASFDRAFVSSTRLSGVDLRDSSFEGAELYRADFDHSDLRGAAFDHAFIVGTFNSTCVSNAGFVGARFNMAPEGGDYPRSETMFVGAYGQDVDFSDAVNLSSVRLGPGVTRVRFDGATERPKAARPAGTFENAGPCN